MNLYLSGDFYFLSLDIYLVCAIRSSAHLLMRPLHANNMYFRIFSKKKSKKQGLSPASSVYFSPATELDPTIPCLDQDEHHSKYFLL